ncbi:hypothetical protein Taro_029669 [Colocasia esculenta]|uniref:Uncharacterized protein n=1 Tax=Colocasia esculenta TaxID=4460 RepID=A0A843VXV3_COLES|nr:hypothetical protein [Colocasia esculenta]
MTVGQRLVLGAPARDPRGAKHGPAAVCLQVGYWPDQPVVCSRVVASFFLTRALLLAVVREFVTHGRGLTSSRCALRARPGKKGKRTNPPVIATARPAAITVGSRRPMASRQERGGADRRDSPRTGPDRPGPVSRPTAPSRLETRRIKEMTNASAIGPDQVLGGAPEKCQCPWELK